MKQCRISNKKVRLTLKVDTKEDGLAALKLLKFMEKLLRDPASRAGLKREISKMGNFVASFSEER